MTGWAAGELMHKVNELIFYSVGGVMTFTGIILFQEFIYELLILGAGLCYAGYRKF